jgi:hypothetical protein
MLHIDIPTLAEFPGQLTSKMDERDNACTEVSAAKPRKQRYSFQSCGRSLLSRSSRLGVSALD